MIRTDYLGGEGGSGSGFTAASIPYTYIYKTNNTPAATALTINVPIKVVATTTRDAANSSAHWTMPSNNRITYTGNSHKALLTLNVSGCSGVGGGNYKHRIYKGGVALNSVVYALSFHAVTDRPFPTSLTMLVDVATGEYFEIWTEETITGVSFLTEVLTLQADFAGWL